MDSKIELLAPAGSWDSFVAAVENGADAVYMGGQLFNARQFAANFDKNELERAIDYAHVRSVRIYLTMNTLLDDAETEQALEYLIHPYKWGIDGLIVQDIGFAEAVKRYFGGLDLHASTQMTTYNIEGVKFLERMGFKRVVLARELSLDEILDITGQTGMEIEIFVHGALCVSYSGQCLMSSMIGGRSGNRGKCAQPCRQKYELVTLMDGQIKTPRKYLLSPRDLCSAAFLDKIATSGVKSLKIEGRMKSPEYVAVVVGTYRKYLDRVSGSTVKDKFRMHNEDNIRLAQIFNRGGFTSGYLLGKTGKDMMCFEKPKNQGISLGDAISYEPSGKLLKIKLQTDIGTGDGVEVRSGEDESSGNIITEIRVNGKKTERAYEGQIAEIGSLSGNIKRGAKVCKTSDKSLNEEVGETFSGKIFRRIPLDAHITVVEGEKAVFKVTDEQGNKALAISGSAAETALTAPLQEERVLAQLSKTGSTPFYFRHIDVKLKGNPAMSAGSLNNLRRTALSDMEQKIISSGRRNGWKVPAEGFACQEGTRYIRKQKADCFKTSVYLHRLYEDIDYSKVEAGRINIPLRYFFGDGIGKLVEIFKDKGTEVFVFLPSITRGKYDLLIKRRLEEIARMGIDGFTAGNHGALEILRDYAGIAAEGYSELSAKGHGGISTEGYSGLNAEWHGRVAAEGFASGKKSADRYTRYGGCGEMTPEEPQTERHRLRLAGSYSLNAFNSTTLDTFYRMGLDSATISPELNLKQIIRLRTASKINLEAMVYGRFVLMTSEYCPSGSTCGGFSAHEKCRGCPSEPVGLKDKMNAVFPVVTDNIDHRSSIYNSNVLLVPEICGALKKAGISLFRLDFLYERSEDIFKIVTLYNSILEYGDAVLNDYAQLISDIKRKGFTKGHYFRGV